MKTPQIKVFQVILQLEKTKFTIKKVVKIEQLPGGSLTAVVKGYFE